MDKQILIHWWNFRKKTLDYDGGYKEFFKKKGIAYAKITHPQDKTIKGTRFKIKFASVIITIDAFDQDETVNYDMAILAFLTILGDKSKFINGYGRTYKINWN